MTKVLFFMHLPPPIHGVTVCNDLLAKSKLIHSSVDSRILPIRYSRTIEGMQSNGVDKKILIMILYLFKLLSELVFHRPNVVYFTISPLGSAFLRDALFVLFIKLFRVKLIYHLHGKGIKSITSPSKKFLYRFVFHNSSVICISDLLAKDIEGVFSNAKIFICPNGIDFNASNRDGVIEGKKELINGERPLNVLFLSNLSPVKGVDIYLEMVADVIRKSDKVSFHIAGPFSNVFTQVEYDTFLKGNPHVEGSLFYHGSVYDEDKWSLLSKMDVLIHPTRNDAFPLVILEAMAVGCVILSTSQGGIPDILNGLKGSYVLDETEFSSALLRLIGMKDILGYYTEESFQCFDSKFSKEMFEKKILDIIDM